MDTKEIIRRLRAISLTVKAHPSTEISTFDRIIIEVVEQAADRLEELEVVEEIRQPEKSWTWIPGI